MTQPEAIEIMKSGRNIFLTGPPGAGKTYTLDKFIEYAEEKDLHIAVTASTGIAASHIGGVTIHSWSGLGILDALTPQETERISKNGKITKRYRNTHILIIDEISMLHGARLDMVNTLAKKFRKNDRPFGGMQVIMVGDLFQLPPVSRDTDLFDFAHLCQSWADLDPAICYLTEQHRQEGDDPLLDLLIAMRKNALTPAHRELLEHRNAGGGDKITRLYTHNVDVDRINSVKLAELPGKIKKFKMVTGGDNYKVQALTRNILAPETLELKVGAEVMFVANNFKAGFVNGTRGTVKNFAKTGEPIVVTESGRKIRVEPHEWVTKEDELIVATAVQTPLRLAWAITVHKSQGMSLDSAEIDLSKAFTTGMGYVALSRVRSLGGLYITGLNDMALRMHAEIYEFDAILQQKSEANCV